MSNKCEADSPTSPTSVGYTVSKKISLATSSNPFILESGYKFDFVEVEYETYGNLNATKSNAILITHALSGDAHVAGWCKNYKEIGRLWLSKKPGWWDKIIGPGKYLDTNKYFIICSNVLGSCFGTTGPNSINPKTKKHYGLSFPFVSVGDWVALQARLIDALGIDKLFGVVGGSLGGQQVLEWALSYPDRVKNAAVLATATKLSAEGIAFNAVGRHAILNDPNFNGGNYYKSKKPDVGLAVARMLAHITYLSHSAMDKKFGRDFQNSSEGKEQFQVESYLTHQGKSFIERFDANSYLYITKAMDHYDAASKWGGGDLQKAVERLKANMLVVTFSTDWLYSPREGKQLALAIAKSGKKVSYMSVASDAGHDAFLVECDKVGLILKNFFDAGVK